MSINIAVIGTGYWGKNYLRIINELEETELSAIVDIDPNKRILGKIYKTFFTTDVKKILKDDSIDAVILVVPSNQHYKMAKEIICSGKHVLVEKPLALNWKNAEELFRLSIKENVILACGHIFSFNSAIQYLKQRVIDQKILGELYFMISTRMGFFPPRKDSGIILDLAIHDIDITTYLRNRELPRYVTARGSSYIRHAYEELSFITLEFDSKEKTPFLSHLIASWMTPVKVRDVWVIGSDGSAYINLMTQDLEIFEATFEHIIKETEDIENKGNSFYHDIRAKLGSSYKPYFQKEEPLRKQVANFVNSIQNKEKPLVDGKTASEIIYICEMARKSIDQDRRVEISLEKTR